MPAGVSSGLTPTGLRLVLVITGLSVAHHIDHVVRKVTGWPLEGGFNTFSASLFVYPVIAGALVLSHRQRVGPRFWAVLAGGALVFVVAVHVGPAAGDSVTSIPEQHRSGLAAVVAMGLLAAFAGALLAHCVYETRILLRARRANGRSS